MIGFAIVEGREKELEKKFEAGEIILREGDDSREMFVIQHGRVEVSKDVGGRKLRLAELNKGDFFGEMSLLESLPRAATVTALEPTQVLVIQAGSLVLRFRRDPTFAFELLQRLSSRIRTMNQRLEQALKSGELSEESAKEILDGQGMGNV